MPNYIVVQDANGKVVAIDETILLAALAEGDVKILGCKIEELFQFRTEFLKRSTSPITADAITEAFKERALAFWEAQAEWSRATFGSDEERGPIGPLKHLAKEVAEAQANPTDKMEFVDCLFLVFDAARRAGLTFDELLTLAFEKLEVNKKREWPKPGASDEPVEHDRTADVAAAPSAISP